MLLNDFHFTLPPELIARYPLAKRSASRLLCLDHAQGPFVHRQFTDVLDLIHKDDLLVFNNTKVIPARIIGKKPSGGRVEILLERVLDSKRIWAQLRASKPPHISDVLLFSSYCLSVLGRYEQFYELELVKSARTILQVFDEIGQIPLPPYLDRLPDESDRERYQTIYAKHLGSVAAPTAGFHFDEALLQTLRNQNIAIGELTLHIGAGTFLPVRVESIHDHHMHAEYLEVSSDLCRQIEACRARGGRVIAVGTTSLRALEAASLAGNIRPYAGDTRIFITPGYTFRCVDALITNLHLPCSTLLMLVSAFGGHQAVMRAYEEAVNQQYRFYSYGDAMWVVRR